MEGWMDGWIGWTDERMNSGIGWKDGWMDGWDGRMKG